MAIDLNGTSSADFLPNPAAYSTPIEPMKMSTPLVEIIPPGLPIDRSKFTDLRTQLTNRLQQATGTAVMGSVSATGQVVPSRVQQPIIVSAVQSSPTPINMYKPGVIMPYMTFPTQLVPYPPEMLQPMQMAMPPMYQPAPAIAPPPDEPKRDQFEEIASIIASAKKAAASSTVPRYTFTKGRVSGYNTRRRSDRGNRSSRENRQSRDNDKDNSSNNNSQRSSGGSSGSGGNNNNNNNNNGRENGHNNNVVTVDEDEDEEKSESNKKKRTRDQVADSDPSATDVQVKEIESDNGEETPPVKKPRLTIPQPTLLSVEPINSSESRATQVTRETTNTSTFAVGSPVPMPVPRVSRDHMNLSEISF